MSGGTDSSVVCMMLLEKGYDIQGVTMRMWDTPSKFTVPDQEQPDYILKAQKLAAKLGFAHHIMDIRQDFQKCVIGNFVDEYIAGRTPNPCVQCNIHIKTKYLLEKATELGCDYVATGHYANIVAENGVYFIEKGQDPKKDQSYFLWGLKQDVLSKMIFPLGNYTKDYAREIAVGKGFSEVATQSESQDICFIDDDYRTFLNSQPTFEGKAVPGNFIDIHGKVLGQHKGCAYYTIGQRKGLEIALGRPMYVVKINAERNQVTLADREYLQMQELKIRNCVFPLIDENFGQQEFQVRIRYKSQAYPANVEMLDNNQAKISFLSPVEAVTAGQSAVIYSGERVVGGGVIC